MPLPLTPVTLRGNRVRLEPLSLDHVQGLLASAAEARKSFRFTWVPEPNDSEVARYIESALGAHAAGTALPFATIRIDTETVVGSTRFMSAEYWASPDGKPSDSVRPNAIEIGSTWLRQSAQRTFINTEAKLLMMSYAFEQLDVDRLFFKTDARNTTSRTNIERVGAKFEGILRHNMYSSDGANDGYRDSAYYSLLHNEWPEAKTALLAKLRD
jgi:RimJ/RimL family protein N-acetyltransferase